jgi:hypothetical protein
MVNQQKLLELISEALTVCKAEATIHPLDTERRKATLEYNTLIRHFNMAMAAGNDQAELDRIIDSLEESLFVRHQRWRELSTVKKK